MIDGNGFAIIMQVTGGTGTVIRGLSFIDGQDAIRFTGVSSNTISGCWFGVDNTGNAGGGAYNTNIRFINSGSNTIGGATVQERNIISLANNEGIKFESLSNSNTISGNYIGLGKDGTTALGNGNGIWFDNSRSNTIGGTTRSLRNVVASSGTYGMRFENNSTGNIVKGNFVGLAADGKTNRGNGEHGISYISGSDNGVVGGTTLPERNVSAGNGRNGITFEDCDGHTIINNYSGVDSTGNTGVGNGWSAISFTRSDNNTITDNVLSGCSNEGVWIGDSDNLVFTGNMIGLDADGSTAIGNGKEGIKVNSSTNVRIGGTTYAERNIISSNNWDGVHFDNSDNGVVKGNFVGLAADGLTDRGNNSHGIKFASGSDNATIGGSTRQERNVVGGNGQNGILLENSTNGTVENNYSGVDSTGNTQVANGQSGLALPSTSNSTVQDNILSGNNNEGIWFQNSDNNNFYRNLIGVALDGSDMGNGSNGIQLSNNSNGNVFGGSLVNANTIAYNGDDGISVRDGSSNNNLITFNSIHCNVDKGIDLQGGSQSGIGTPAIVSTTINDVVGTGTSGNTVHVYKSITTGANCNCEGEIYLGSTVVDGSGNWTLTHNLNVHPSQQTTITATQSDGSNNTSEFSGCVSDPMPVSFLYVNATNIDSGVNVNWATAMEDNNDYFAIQRSIDGLNFITIGYADGAGTTNEMTVYNFLDEGNNTSNLVYYRLLQVDLDGSTGSSQIVSVHLETGDLSIYPNPTSSDQGLIIVGTTRDFIYSIIDMTGREVSSGISKSNSIKIPYELAIGSYILKLRSFDNKVVEIERFLLTAN